MIITIHQPEHLPYFGFLDKVNKSDIFVILDDVDFKKNNFQNRNQILTSSGAKWVGITIETKGLDNKFINARKVKGNWKESYNNKIVEAYRKYPFYDEGIAIIDKMLKVDSSLLMEFNIFYMKELFRLLEIKTNLIFSSELNITTTKTQRLSDICEKLNGTSYLAGQGAIDYLDEDIFKNNIKILKHNFIHPKYEQLNSEEFVPYMSSLDIIMSVGIDGLKRMLNESKKDLL